MTVITKTCIYPNCNSSVHSPHDENYCLGHAPIENKKVTAQEFDSFIRQKIRRNELNFDGFIFCTTGFIDFNDLRGSFNNFKFNRCQFLGEKLEGDEKYSLSIEGFHFQSTIEFINCEFSGTIRFSNCSINDTLSIQKSKIKGGLSLNAGRLNKLNIEKSKLFKSVDFLNSIQINEVEVLHSEIGGVKSIQKIDFKKTFHLNETIISQKTLLNYCVFHSGFTFTKCIFNAEVDFSGSTFKDLSIINNNTFNSDAVFENVIFNKEVQFGYTTFNRNAVFNKTEFAGLSLWQSAIFNKSYFNDVTFKGEANFSSSSFNGSTEFIRTTFSDRAIFNNASFLDNKQKSKSFLPTIYFQNTVFNYVTEFKDLNIGGYTLFDHIYLQEKSIFYFQRVHLKDRTRIIFQDISFPSFQAFFENIGLNISKTFLPSVIAFRNCNLKDIYFTNNKMSVFSFYTSTFDNSIFASNKWEDNEENLGMFKYQRKNLIFEDQLLDKISRESANRKLKILKIFELEESDGYNEIANLYRRFKLPLDNVKDYEQAGWFYFNEYEMKRRDAKTKSKSKYFLYSLYKLFAGYGEKPLWSFYWFLLFISLFTFNNLFTGIKVNTDKIINYEFSFNADGLITLFTAGFWSDIFYSFLFTLYRIVPVGYLPFPKEQFLPIGGDGYFLAFLNTVVLILFLTFIGVGLKRIFRRF